jgi:hypothetical protein
MRGNQLRGNNFSAATDGNARSCIYARNHITALPLLDLCSTDATTVRMTYRSGRSCEELIITSAYLPYDSDEPSPARELRTSSTTSAAGKSTSPMGVMPMHTT